MRKMMEDPGRWRSICCIFTVICLSVLWGLATPPARAQEDDDFRVFPHSAPKGIMLIILGDMLCPSSAGLHDGWAGYHIYRRAAGDAGFTRITEVPLVRPGSLAELERKLGGPIDGLEKLIGAESKQELWQRIERDDQSILALMMLSRRMRDALGQLWWDYDVVRGRTYEYRATRVDASGNESEPSATMEATFGVPPFPLLGPVDVEAEGSNNRVMLTWEVNPADSGAFTYAVYRSPTPHGSLIRLNTSPIGIAGAPDQEGPPTGVFADTTARNGRSYYYAVVSMDYAGNESPQEPLIVGSPFDNAAPPIPQEVVANPSELGIAVTWAAVNDPGLAGYNIYRSTDPDSDFVKINDVVLPRDTCYYEDRSADLATRFFYRVTSLDLAGNESKHSARALSAFRNYRRPLPPQDLAAEGREGGIYLTWEANQEADLQGYYVFRADRYGGELSQVSPLIAADTTFYLDADPYLSPRGRYWYVVQAMNYTGVPSKYSVPVIATVKSAEGPEPALSFYGYQDEIGNRLFWNVPDDNMIRGFNVYRAVSADSLDWHLLTPRPIAREIAEYTDRTAEIGVEYAYQVRSLDADSLEGEGSHYVMLRRFESAPLPPSNIRVVEQGSALKIVWDVTRQPSVTGYRVYRRVEGQQDALISTRDLPVLTSEYTDKNVAKNRRYYYSVSCVDRYGRESVRSSETSFNFR